MELSARVEPATRVPGRTTIPVSWTMQFDITLLTDRRYDTPENPDWYAQQILDDDILLRNALEAKGLRVARTYWDNPDFDWAQTRCAIFRTTWDYFNRYAEFMSWLDRAGKQTRLINPIELILWNVDKHYLHDLSEKGVRIPPTRFIETGDTRPLEKVAAECGWPELILKPAVSGAARHTYRLSMTDLSHHEDIYRTLVQDEAMLLQEFQHKILSEGEVSLMVIGGKHTHAVLKTAKAGDFRVQDDFGGKVQSYKPTEEEVQFAERVVSLCSPLPVYARVDMIRNNLGQICLSELELIEPELWIRMNPQAASQLAESITTLLTHEH